MSKKIGKCKKPDCQRRPGVNSKTKNIYKYCLEHSQVTCITVDCTRRVGKRGDPYIPSFCDVCWPEVAYWIINRENDEYFNLPVEIECYNCGHEVIVETRYAFLKSYICKRCRFQPCKSCGVVRSDLNPKEVISKINKGIKVEFECSRCVQIRFPSKD